MEEIRVMKKLLLAAAAMASLVPASANASILLGVDELNNLIRYDSAAPGTTLSSVAISGVSGSSILAMDYRVADSKLYALTDDFMLYTINTFNGAASLVTGLALSGSNFAFDFNPANTNLRIVSNDNTNYVRNFTSGLLVPGVNVAYGAMDPNVGLDPDVTSAGYLNNDNNPMTGTTLFVIDSRNDVLATQNPMTGVLTTVGSLGQNVGSRTSFDIRTVGTSNTGFVQNGSTLYSINLATGALTALGNTDRAIFALTAGIPEPATWAMMLGGFGLVGFGMRRRKAMKTAVALA
jgi:Domain of unknown function (DUF4394)/PEP-CTERM motif